MRVKRKVKVVDGVKIKESNFDFAVRGLLELSKDLDTKMMYEIEDYVYMIVEHRKEDLMIIDSLEDRVDLLHEEISSLYEEIDSLNEELETK